MTVTCTNLATGSSSAASGTVTVAAQPHNVLLAVSAFCPSASTFAAPTVSGLGLSWSLVTSATGDTKGSDGSAAYLFLGTGTGAPGDITVTFAQSTHMNMVADDIDGGDVSVWLSATDNANGSKASSTGSLGFSTHYGYAALGIESNGVTVTPPSAYTQLATEQTESYCEAFTYWGGAAPSGGSWSFSASSYYSLLFADLQVTPTSTPPASGSATGSLVWTDSAHGSAAPVSESHGSATDALVWTDSATGSAPTLDFRFGMATETLVWTDLASGSIEPSGRASDGLSWTDSATGHSDAVPPSTGSAMDSLSWSDSATGHLDPAGSATDALIWSDAATGHTPEVGAASGSVSDSLVWLDSATGLHAPHGSASDALAWTDAANGSVMPSGRASNSLSWSEGAIGHAPTVAASGGYAEDSLLWATMAYGSATKAGTTSDTLTWTDTTRGHTPALNEASAVDNPILALTVQVTALRLTIPVSNIQLKEVNAALSVTTPRSVLEVDA